MPHRYFTTEISDGTATLRGADAHHLARVKMCIRDRDERQDAEQRLGRRGRPLCAEQELEQADLVDGRHAGDHHVHLSLIHILPDAFMTARAWA